MGRSLLYGVLRVNGQTFGIGTVHLESLDNEPLRKAQLITSVNVLGQLENSVLMGDFNFDNQVENPRIEESGYQDVWSLLKDAKEECFTMKKTMRFCSWRPDRFIINKKSAWKPAKIERIGMEPIPKYKESSNLSNLHPDTILTPSDHFGLYVEI